MSYHYLVNLVLVVHGSWGEGLICSPLKQRHLLPLFYTITSDQLLSDCKYFVVNKAWML